MQILSTVYSVFVINGLLSQCCSGSSTHTRSGILSLLQKPFSPDYKSSTAPSPAVNSVKSVKNSTANCNLPPGKSTIILNNVVYSTFGKLFFYYPRTKEPKPIGKSANAKYFATSIPSTKNLNTMVNDNSPTSVSNQNIKISVDSYNPDESSEPSVVLSATKPRIPTTLVTSTSREADENISDTTTASKNMVLAGRSLAKFKLKPSNTSSGGQFRSNLTTTTVPLLDLNFPPETVAYSKSPSVLFRGRTLFNVNNKTEEYTKADNCSNSTTLITTRAPKTITITSPIPSAMVTAAESPKPDHRSVIHAKRNETALLEIEVEKVKSMYAQTVLLTRIADLLEAQNNIEKDKLQTMKNGYHIAPNPNPPGF